MKWDKVLSKWENGSYPKFSKMKEPFIWRTSPSIQYQDSKYIEECIKSPSLNVPSNYDAFSSKFTKKNKYVVDFFNLSKDTVLVCPIPKNSKNYSNIYSFTKNASNTQKIAFWKKVASVARREQKKHGTIWISTHGFGVAWLHVRISSIPKYYGTSKLKIIVV
jgi:hypothetical protein